MKILISIAFIGLSIGFLMGLSITPIVSETTFNILILTLSLLVGYIVKNKSENKELELEKIRKSINFLPLAFLVTGISIGSFSGMIIRMELGVHYQIKDNNQTMKNHQIEKDEDIIKKMSKSGMYANEISVDLEKETCKYLKLKAFKIRDNPKEEKEIKEKESLDFLISEYSCERYINE